MPRPLCDLVRDFAVGVTIGLAAFAGAGALRASPAAAESLSSLRVGYDISMSAAPMEYALEKGIFRKYGLDLKPIYVDAGTTMTQALVGGSLDIGENGYAPATAAALAGADIVFIGGISNKLPFQLVVKNGINSAADLKGKKIAISRYGSATDIAAQIALTYLGLTKSDVIVLQVGGEGTRTAAMMSGQIDGSLEQYPRTGELEQEGFHVLVDCTKVAGDYPNTSYDTTRTFIARRHGAVKKFMAALSEGIHAYDTNRSEALASTIRFMKAKPGKPMEEAYDLYTKEVFPEPPYPSLAGIQTILDDMKAKVPAAAKIKPEQLVDTSALNELKKEGFFKTLE